MFQNDEDKKIYKEFLNGNCDALGKLMIKYKSNLIYFIFKYVKNEEVAEDIFQDVVIYLLEKKEVYNFKYSFKTFVYIIAKSRALNYIKLNKDKKYLLEDKEEILLEEIIISKDRQEKIKKVIGKLNEEYQMVIYLALIEDLSYKEIAQIMNKSVIEVKNLLHRARVKLRKLLIDEGVVEMKNNKVVKILICFVVVGIVSAGIVYAVTRMTKNDVKENNTNHHISMNPTFQSTIAENTINNLWIGTLDLAWKELEKKIGTNKIEIDGGNPEIADDLNESKFSKEMLNSKDYKIEVERTLTDGYKINASLNKNLNFLKPFDNFSDYYTNLKFGNSEEDIKYFGINNASSDELNNNLEILFYNQIDESNLFSRSNDFAVKLKTQEGDEIILYRTDDIKSFDEYYKDVEIKTKEYKGDRKFLENDELRIPYVRVNGLIAYNELYGKSIKNTPLIIYDVVQDVNFSLNEKGCNLSSDVTFVTECLGIGARYFYFTDTFVIFMKEKEVDTPYFALKVDNSDILEKIDELDEPKIIDFTTIDGFNYKILDGEYKFFEDEKFEYFYTSKKTPYVYVYFKDGKKDTVEWALRDNLITIDLLDKYGIEYIKKEK